MNSLNSILIEGNLVADPRADTTSKGLEVTEFAVASDRFYRSGEDLKKEVSFFEVVGFGKLALRCSEFLTKGRGVRVVGRLKQYRWTNKNGDHRTQVKIVAEHVEFKPTFSRASETAIEAEAPPFGDVSDIDEL